MALTQSHPNHYELHDPDVRLMLQVRDGDAAAFTELVLRYQNRLLTVLEHLVGNREQAEDLARHGPERTVAGFSRNLANLVRIRRVR